MSFPVGKRKEGTLKVNIEALELCKYTLSITSNQNTFPTDQISLVEKIREAALDIHLLCWEANNIRVNNNHELYERRIGLQNEAINRCNRLCALIELAYPLFHLSTKRVTYWIEKTLSVRSLITAWRSSDKDRLRPEE